MLCGLAAVVFLAAPASAWAHAALLRTSPSASVTLNQPPAMVTLTYSERVEARFSVVSVTDAGGHQQATAPPSHPPTNPDGVAVPVRHLPEGWYLVFWRVISADGHPVRGAFTFAVGPNPGPAPQFVIPSTSETAATPPLLIARWLVFLSLATAVGLLVMRLVLARSLPSRVPGTSLRALSGALAVSIGVALVATPIYAVMATAKFALRSSFDLGGVVPLLRVTTFGRGYLDLELLLALLALAAWLAIKLDRPERRERPTVAILALLGAVATGLAALVVPSAAGHAAQASPWETTVFFDWLHLVSGSVWVGGLVGLVVLWLSLPGRRRVESLAVVVPRFALTAFTAVSVLIATGIAEALKWLPTLGSLLDTAYGHALDVKLVLLAAALVLAAGNLVFALPRLIDARTRPEIGPTGATVLLRLVAGQVLLVVGALFAAGVLSSLPPPAKALANLGAVAARVGPGPVKSTLESGPYRVTVNVSPNRAAVPNSFSIRVTKDGKPVRGANVTARFTMLDMEMSQLAYHLPERSPGVFGRSAPALVMVGRWGLGLEIVPPGSTPFNVTLVDHAGG